MTDALASFYSLQIPLKRAQLEDVLKLLHQSPNDEELIKKARELSAEIETMETYVNMRQGGG